MINEYGSNDSGLPSSSPLVSSAMQSISSFDNLHVAKSLPDGMLSTLEGETPMEFPLAPLTPWRDAILVEADPQGPRKRKRIAKERPWI